MCDSLVPVVQQVIVLHPQASGDWSRFMPESLALMDSQAAILAVLILSAMLIGFLWWMGYRLNPASRMGSEGLSGRTPERAQPNRATIAAIFLFALALGSGTAFGDVSGELKVLGPSDNTLATTIKEISQSYSDAYNVPVNITLMRGREMVLKEVMKNGSEDDVVVLEKEYPLFNLSGMQTLQDEGLIENYTYLYTQRALMIFRTDEPIGTLADLEGMRVSVTDQHVPGACLANKIIEREGLNVTKETVSSNEAQLDAVVSGSADATVLWESMFKTYSNSTSSGIEYIDLPEYRMDNFIAVLNRSGDPSESERYVNYLLEALSSVGK